MKNPFDLKENVPDMEQVLHVVRGRMHEVDWGEYFINQVPVEAVPEPKTEIRGEAQVISLDSRRQGVASTAINQIPPEIDLKSAQHNVDQAFKEAA